MDRVGIFSLKGRCGSTFMVKHNCKSIFRNISGEKKGGSLLPFGRMEYNKEKYGQLGSVWA